MRRQIYRLVGLIIALMLNAIQGFAQSVYTPFTFITFAGLRGNAGYIDGSGSAALFNNPNGVAVDEAGNIYVADSGNFVIREVTPGGSVTTLAGQPGIAGAADGAGNAAQFSNVSGVAPDHAGNLFVADYSNHTIRKVSPTGEVTTLAGLAGIMGSDDGTGSAARFFLPSGLAVDGAGNVYVADSGNHTIRQVTPDGTVTTLAGLAASPGSADGTGSAARFNRPGGVALDQAGNIYVADLLNATIRRVTQAGAVTTLAGLAWNGGSADGTGSAARFSGPSSVAVDSAGNVYVTDTYNSTIRKVTPTGVVTTLAGLASSYGSVDGTGSTARFWGQTGVAVDTSGSVYVADTANNTIRKGFPYYSVPHPILSPPSLRVDQIGLGLSGLPGLEVIVESSSDLSSWEPLGIRVLAGGTNWFVSQIATKGAQFYRARVR